MRMKLIASETVQMAFSMRFRLRHDWDSSDPERLPGKPTRTQRKTAAGSKWIGHTGSTIDSIKDSKGDSSQIFISPYSSLHIHLSMFICPCLWLVTWTPGRTNQIKVDCKAEAKRIWKSHGEQRHLSRFERRLRPAAEPPEGLRPSGVWPMILPAPPLPFHPLKCPLFRISWGVALFQVNLIWLTKLLPFSYSHTPSFIQTLPQTRAFFNVAPSADRPSQLLSNVFLPSDVDFPSARPVHNYKLLADMMRSFQTWLFPRKAFRKSSVEKFPRRFHYFFSNLGDRATSSPPPFSLSFLYPVTSLNYSSVSPRCSSIDWASRIPGASNLRRSIIYAESWCSRFILSFHVARWAVNDLRQGTLSIGFLLCI